MEVSQGALYCKGRMAMMKIPLWIFNRDLEQPETEELDT